MLNKINNEEVKGPKGPKGTIGVVSVTDLETVALNTEKKLAETVKNFTVLRNTISNISIFDRIFNFDSSILKEIDAILNEIAHKSKYDGIIQCASEIRKAHNKEKKAVVKEKETTAEWKEKYKCLYEESNSEIRKLEEKFSQKEEELVKRIKELAYTRKNNARELKVCSDKLLKMQDKIEKLEKSKSVKTNTTPRRGRLTSKEIEKVFKDIADGGKTRQEIALEMGVNKSTITRIYKGELYKKVGYDKYHNKKV